MTPLEWVDISADHSLPSQTGLAAIGFRACLGTTSDADLAQNKAQSFFPLLAAAKAKWPGIVTLDYSFLAGPLRNEPIDAQMAFYATQHKAELSCLDWEGDSYTVNGVKHDFGMQPFPQVLAAIQSARKHGLNPGVYSYDAALTPAVVKALVAIGIPFLWAAMDPGPLPSYILDCGIPVAHQYQGIGLDRSRFFISLDELHKLAGRKPVPVLAPVPPIWAPNVTDAEVTVLGSATKRVDLYRLDGITPYSGVIKPTTFPAPLIAPGWTGILDGGKYAAVKNADLAKGS